MELASRMLAVVRIDDPGIEAKLHDGSALQQFKQMVACHSGNIDADLSVAKKQIPLPTPSSGFISKCDPEAIGRVALLLGAGRAKTTDSIDHAVGISNLKKIGEKVEMGESLCTIHSNGHENIAQMLPQLKNAFDISSHPAKPPPLILEMIS